MSQPIIEVKNISKSYKIGTRERYYSLRDSLAHIIKSPFKELKKEQKIFDEVSENTFWALKDISFKVMPGEAVGIIGRNGAGKSTLLKILSQITPPTKGEIILRGRVASLLEVGTGFHPELTGRENIYLNGALLGMSRKEIKKKFDEIVDFAEVSQFLDTPVKHYSSGMYTRLAFAVAAHLEPEILVVDEVLAVGDAQFQKKCLGKMGQISKEGRTVLFVSHNMETIGQLCSRTILLDKGKIIQQGNSVDVINTYTSTNNTKNTEGLTIKTKLLGDNKEWVKGGDLAIDINWEDGRFGDNWECDLAFYTMQGSKLFALQSTLLPGFEKKEQSTGIRFIIKNPGFSQKDIRVDMGVKLSPVASEYEVLVENCLFIKPSTKGLTKFVHQVANEGIIIPDSSCQILNSK